jgi:uncharacterized protein YndB with AHSA1/START domain
MTLAPFPVPPIVKTVTVRAAPARAFALFAGDFARWWPLSRVHTGPDPVDCAIEPRVGGRVFERAADGHETAWGTVLAYDPPHRTIGGTGNGASVIPLAPRRSLRPFR